MKRWETKKVDVAGHPFGFLRSLKMRSKNGNTSLVMPSSKVSMTICGTSATGRSRGGVVCPRQLQSGSCGVQKQEEEREKDGRKEKTRKRCGTKTLLVGEMQKHKQTNQPDTAPLRRCRFGGDAVLTPSPQIIPIVDFLCFFAFLPYAPHRRWGRIGRSCGS